MENEKRNAHTRVGGRSCMILRNVGNKKEYKPVRAYLNSENILVTYGYKSFYGDFELTDVCLIEEAEYEKILKNEDNKRIEKEKKIKKMKKIK
jgi:hypothetical protein